jgi:hypothetical protein
MKERVSRYNTSSVKSFYEEVELNSIQIGGAISQVFDEYEDWSKITKSEFVFKVMRKLGFRV